MPYIEQRYRDLIDPEIDALIDGLRRFDQGGTVPDGAINYVFTRILLAFFDQPASYFNLERVVGLLECIKMEYMRRVGEPMENMKSIQNGDVYDAP